MIIRFDFPETASSALHIVHAAENVGYYGIAAPGGYLVRIQVLHQRAVEHSDGRIDFHSVIKDINMNFTSDFRIIPVLCKVISYVKKGAVKKHSPKQRRTKGQK